MAAKRLYGGETAKAVDNFPVSGERVPIQYFQWHKRDNVLSYPPKTWHAPRRRKLQVAYAEATYAEAQHAPPAARQGTPETQGLRRPEPWRRP